jgi:hypothetical protein
MVVPEEQQALLQEHLQHSVAHICVRHAVQELGPL